MVAVYNPLSNGHFPQTIPKQPRPGLARGGQRQGTHRERPGTLAPPPPPRDVLHGGHPELASLLALTPSALLQGRFRLAGARRRRLRLLPGARARRRGLAAPPLRAPRAAQGGGRPISVAPAGLRRRRGGLGTYWGRAEATATGAARGAGVRRDGRGGRGCCCGGGRCGDRSEERGGGGGGGVRGVLPEGEGEEKGGNGGPACGQGRSRRRSPSGNLD